jgi:hypothetical protein
VWSNPGHHRESLTRHVDLKALALRDEALTVCAIFLKGDILMKRILTPRRLSVIGIVAALALGGTSAALGATDGTQKAIPPAPTDKFIVTGALVTNPAFSQTFASVACPANTKASGGGIFGSGGTGQSVNSSYPSGGGWAGYMNNTTSTASSFRVYAICGFGI